jgi:hypothetical protein
MVLSIPNILCSVTTGASQFFKDLIWIASAAKLGYRWHIDNGHRIKFWKDYWLAFFSLPIHLYWEIYVLINEK